MTNEDLAPCWRCKLSDGLWVNDSPEDPPELRYNVECVCGLSGPPRATPEDARSWWNDRTGGSK